MNTTKGTWAWACAQMLAGKRVRRPEFIGCSMYIDELDELTVSGKGGVFTLDADDLRATDWEIAK